MNRFIEGAQIYLRAITAEDATDEYLSWINDPETTRGLATGAFPSTIEDLKKYIAEVSNGRKAIMLAICDTHNNTHIGNIKLDQFDWINRTCELGLLLGNKTYWGKGIGTEVCRLTLHHAFTKLNLRKVVLAVYANNPGAIKLYERIGFKHEGCLRKQIFCDGEYIDKYYMGIFSEELTR